MNPLEGQRVLVTGATGDIGTAIVRAIATTGGEPLVHCVNRQSRAWMLVEEIGAGVVVTADLEAPDGPQILWRTCTADGAKVDALVLNAGRRSEIQTEASWDDWHTAWQRDHQINLQANADLCRLACAHFAARGAGKILAIASRAGQHGYSWNALPYGATKAGLINLIKSIATTYGPQGVVAAAIAPGWVDSAMARAYTDRHGEHAALADIPIGAMVDRAELGELVTFLLRPSQRSVNGATIDLNGGSYIR